MEIKLHRLKGMGRETVLALISIWQLLHYSELILFIHWIPFLHILATCRVQMGLMQMRAYTHTHTGINFTHSKGIKHKHLGSADEWMRLWSVNNFLRCIHHFNMSSITDAHIAVDGEILSFQRAERTRSDGAVIERCVFVIIKLFRRRVFLSPT